MRPLIEMSFESKQGEISMNRCRMKPLIGKQLCSMVLLTSFVAASARAQTPATSTANDDPCETSGAAPSVSLLAFSLVPSGLPLMAANGTRTNIDQRIIKEFDNAWRASGDGTNGREGVVLIFRMADGSYTGRSQGFTNQYERFTFKWSPNAVAIVHTHPNSNDPKPAEQDQRVADKYGVPNFTITINGMYVYEPATRKTRKVVDGLDWLDPSRWTEEMVRSVESSLNQVPESGCKQNPAAFAATNVKSPLSQVDTKR